MKKWIFLSLVLHMSIFIIPLKKQDRVEKITDKLNGNFVEIRINSIKTDKGARKSSDTVLKDKKQRKKDKEIISENKITEKNNVIKNLLIEPRKKEVFFKNAEETNITDLNIDTNLLKKISENSKSDKDISNSSENISETKSEEIPDVLYDSQMREFDENLLNEDIADLVKENSELEYKIFESSLPVYPQKAKILNLFENIKITAEFTVGLDGKVKDIILYSDFLKFRKYDFDKAVEKVLLKYRFSNILYRNKKVEVRFKKEFEFNIK